MTVRSAISRLSEHEGLNFLLTNRVPRRALGRFMGWFSKAEQPLIRDLSIATWRLFCDVDLSEAKKDRFKSLHDCFIRELKAGARPVAADPRLLVSPCDGIVGACGAVADETLLQVKGRPYALEELLCDRSLVAPFRRGRYVTLRLTAGMYHRFHAPHACRVEQLKHIEGDSWNVNPATLKRIAKVYCKNERVVLGLELADGHRMALVAVAAVLVGGIRLRFIDAPLEQGGAEAKSNFAHARFEKGEELGWFEHGSTIIVLAPDGFSLCDGVRAGSLVRMGAPLLAAPPVGA